MGLESVLRFPLRHPERGFEDAARLAYGTVCVLLGHDPRPLLPDWPAPTPTPVEATEEGGMPAIERAALSVPTEDLSDEHPCMFCCGETFATEREAVLHAGSRHANNA